MQTNETSTPDDLNEFAEIVSTRTGSEAPPEVPADPSPPAVEAKVEPTPTPPAETPAPAEERRTHTVPLAEHLSERERRQAAERAYQELQARWQAELSQRASPPPATVFDDDAGFVDHRVRNALDPVVQQFQAQKAYNDRLIAEARYGEAAIKAAEEAFNRALSTGQISQGEFAEIAQSPNQFDAALRWHRRNVVLAEFGTDPEAAKAKMRERLLEDDDFLRAAVEKAKTKAASRPPVVAPPARLPTLNDIGTVGAASSSGPATDLAEFRAIRSGKS